MKNYFQNKMASVEVINDYEIVGSAAHKKDSIMELKFNGVFEDQSAVGPNLAGTQI